MGQISVTVNLELKSCPCGCVYAVPSWLSLDKVRCPACAGAFASELAKQLGELRHQLRRANHRIAGLKGRR